MQAHHRSALKRTLLPFPPCPHRKVPSIGGLDSVPDLHTLLVPIYYWLGAKRAGDRALLDIRLRGWFRGTIFVEVARWITYTQAASILDCHFSNVAKLIRTGDLTSSRPALHRRPPHRVHQRGGTPFLVALAWLGDLYGERV